ncbi:Protein DETOXIFICATION 33 [Linum perenne]
MEDCWPCYLHHHFSVLSRCSHPDLRWIRRRVGAGRLLRRELRRRRPSLRRHAWDGECTGDAMWASIRSRTNKNVGGIYAEILGYSLGHSLFIGPCLRLVSFNSRRSLSSLISLILSAGKFAIWMLPQLFAYALNFPIQKFLQAQSKVNVMAWISAIVLVLHGFFSWLLILKLGWGLVGAAVVLNVSWWIIIFAQLGYIFVTKSDGAWRGFSWLAFSDLWGFIKLSLASAIMLCLEFWYLMVLVVITGRLPNPLIPVDAISICMNLNGWDAMIAIGFNAAISVRVSNELGAGNARAAKFSVIVVSATSIVIGVICMIVVFTTKGSFPELFTSSEAVAEETRKLAGLLAITVLLNSLQPVLSGVAIGAGWQSLVAYINIGCYYIVGLPAGILLGFTFGFGVEGIWSGMIMGIVLQTIILVVITVVTDWDSEAAKAGGRVKRWGGGSSLQ